MIKKLRIKFVVYTLISVFAFLGIILSTINIVNFVLVANSADEMTLRIQNNGGHVTPGPNEGPKQGSEPFGPDNPDMRDSLRYFTYRFDQNGNGVVIDYKINSFKQEEALAWATSLKNNLGTGWTRTYYRYRVYEKENMRYVIVIDENRELAPTYNVLYASLIGGGAALVIAGVGAFFLSSRLIKPLVDNENKQNRFVLDAALALRTPLSIISFDNSSLAKKNGESEENKSIKKQTDKMFTLVNDLNSLGTKELLSPEFSEINLSNIVKETAYQFENAFSSNHKILNLDIADEVSYKGDSQMLRKVLSEILENCLKFADSKCDVILKKNSDRIELRFENDCKGIPDGSLDRVFDKFYRLDFKDHSKYDGSGIGLSIVKQIVDSHKGRVLAKGENGLFILKIEL